MKKDVRTEIEIEVVEPRPQRPGPEPSNNSGLRPFPLPDRPGRFLWVCEYLVMGVSPVAPTVADRGLPLPLFTESPRRVVPGDWASGVWSSRNPSFRRCRFSETPLSPGPIGQAFSRVSYSLPTGPRGIL
jgi:hypothetical protein